MMTVKQVSKMTGLGQATLRAYRVEASAGGNHKGPKSDLRVKGQVRYDPAEVQRWLDARTPDFLET